MQSSLKPWLIQVGELLISILFGVIFSFITVILGRLFFPDLRIGFGPLIIFLFALYTAHPLGTAFGSYLYNRRVRGQASFWLALLGSSAGTLSIYILATTRPSLASLAHLNAIVLSLVLVPPLLAVLSGGLGRKARGKKDSRNH